MATASGLLIKPYFGRITVLDIGLAIAGLVSWLWAAWNYEQWVLDAANRSPEKWIPGAVALGLAIEGVRKTCGLAITILVWVFVLYGFFGHLLPGAFEAIESKPPSLVLYLYSDTNAVPGIVLRVGATIVLAFMLMGKVMQLSGATQFFNDLALALMGHRRGGPAKVAIVASSVFGTINGTTVGNIMSTGVVTIPLMRRVGFRPHYAAAVEAVASNGGQLAPPVMGTTAFLIAEFLELPYIDVVLAALLPAVIYYVVLFMQVDRLALRVGLTGIPKAELPSARATFVGGWIFLLPLGVLLYFLFWLGYDPGSSALYAAALLFLFGMARDFRLPGLAYAKALFVDGSRNLVPLILICLGAGLVIGVLNKTGLAQSLVIILADVAENAGMFVMLCVTALIAIALGMGMPTAVVYILLSVVLAPALTKLGVEPMAAHLFIFYFGLLSMLTPPVAVASFVAAGLAETGMWKTGVAGLKLASSAYLVPFLMAFNPALVGAGNGLSIVLVAITALTSGWLLAAAFGGSVRTGIAGMVEPPLLFVLSLTVGTATLWLGPENFLALVPAVVAVVVRVAFDRLVPAPKPVPQSPPEA